MYEIFEKLLKEYGATTYQVAKATGISTASTIEIGLSRTFGTKWKKTGATPQGDTLQKIADYFGVSIEYLMTGKDSSPKSEPALSSKDERDIAKELSGILDKLDSNDGLMFDSDEFDDETRDYLKSSLELALTNAKIMAKRKFTPKKYRKKEE